MARNDRRVWYVWSALHLNRPNFQHELSATLCGAATSATVRTTEVPAKKNLIYAMLVRLTRCTVHELASAFILSCLPSSKVFTSVRTRPQSYNSSLPYVSSFLNPSSLLFLSFFLALSLSSYVLPYLELLHSSQLIRSLLLYPSLLRCFSSVDLSFFLFFF